jgi:hypothetical protein
VAWLREGERLRLAGGEVGLTRKPFAVGESPKEEAVHAPVSRLDDEVVYLNVA